MLPISKRYTHFVFAILQSGLTTAIATAIATLQTPDATLVHWFGSWTISWLIMIPVVALAAPSLRALSERLTRDTAAQRGDP